MLGTMTDDDMTDKEAKSAATKLVKAGVAVGIGSAAIVAALLYASKVKKKPRTLTRSFAAVPFFEPHQLVVIAVGRVDGVELGRERLRCRSATCPRPR